MPATLVFVVIPAPYQVWGRLQRESRGRPPQQVQQDDEYGLDPFSRRGCHFSFSAKDGQL